VDVSDQSNGNCEDIGGRFLPLGRDIRSDFRGSARLLLHRSEALDNDERDIVQAVFGRGLSAAEVARLRGERAAPMRRRIRRLVTRVLSPQFALVMGQRDNWPAARRRVATACFLRGKSIRQAATELNLSFYAARRHHDAVLDLLQPEAA
jgi:hypothetical protein